MALPSQAEELELMRGYVGVVTLFAFSMMLTSAAAFAQAGLDAGKRQYESSCAVCHGVSGKGDGPYKQFLIKPPSDLTVLAKNNGGVLPVSRLYDVIDGRWEVVAHGPREMPVWGRGFIYLDSADLASDPLAGVRILAVIDYISRLQAK